MATSREIHIHVVGIINVSEGYQDFWGFICINVGGLLCGFYLSFSLK